jgi:hypothetical protein
VTFDVHPMTQGNEECVSLHVSKGGTILVESWVTTIKMVLGDN